MCVMNITQSFGVQLRHFRNLKELSQEELADICGLHRTYIGSVERGERNITLLSAEKIAIALGQPLALLLVEQKQ